METPTTFHLFPRLPAELRLRIWDLNLPAWRIVPLRCGADMSSPSPPPPTTTDGTRQDTQETQKQDRDPGCSSPAPIPANLHTCGESRAQALAHYSLHFSFARQPSRVFFDPRTDILYFGPRHDGYMAANAQFHAAMALILPDHLAAARRIAIDDALFHTSPPSPSSCSSSSPYHSSLAVALTADCLAQLHRRMPNLEEVFFAPREAPWLAAHDRALVCDTLAYQVQTALRDLADKLAAQGHEPWVPPSCKILPAPLSSSPGLVC